MHLVLVSLVLSSALGSAAAPAAAPSTLLASVGAYQAAANRHDWRALASLLDQAAVVELGGDMNLAGRDRVHGLHEWERALGTEIRYSDCIVRGDTVTCRATEQNDFLRLSGLGPIDYTASTFTFEQGRIVRMSAVLAEESEAAVGAYMERFMGWATRTAPDSAAAFVGPDGSFAFGYAQALTFKRLLRAYAKLPAARPV